MAYPVPVSVAQHRTMTLTELKYIVALAREKHFGRAADACFVAQPTLSVAVRKLEEELDVKLFERSANEVALTPIGQDVVHQAQLVLEQANLIRDIVKRGKNQLDGPLRLGVIYTIAPYLLPDLIRQNMLQTPQMPLVLQEQFTANLLDMLRTGEIDCAIMAEPFSDTGLALAPLYDEPFWAAMPSKHPLAQQSSVTSQQMDEENMLLLGAGHCFRDHVMQACPEFASFASHAQGLRKNFEGSSLETIKYMVAAGLGVTLVPALSVPAHILQAHDSKHMASDTDSLPVLHAGSPVADSNFLCYRPFAGEIPSRRIVLAWRRSFTRYEAIAALRNAIYACPLYGVQRLS